MSNVITFPVRNPAPAPEGFAPVTDGRYRLWYSAVDRAEMPPANVAQLEVAGRRRSGPNMHTFAFRSYSQIMEAPEGVLVRDVQLDPDKAQTKLRKIRDQLTRDQEHAAARFDLLTKVAARLSAAIDTVRSSRSVDG